MVPALERVQTGITQCGDVQHLHHRATNFMLQIHAVTFLVAMLDTCRDFNILTKAAYLDFLQYT